MINNKNTQNNQERSEIEPVNPVKPDEQGGFTFGGFFKIFDPESEQIIMQGPA